MIWCCRFFNLERPYLPDSQKVVSVCCGMWWVISDE